MTGMRTLSRAATVIAAAALAASLAACGGSHADAKACKAAMKHDFAAALANPSGPPAKRPAACKGLSDAEVRKLAGQVMSGS